MMELKFFLVQLAKSLLLPPGLILVIAAIAIYMFRVGKLRVAKRLAYTGLTLLFLICLPITGDLLMGLVELRYPALSAEQLRASDAQAVVILSGGRNSNAVEYGGETVDHDTVQRVRYGALVHRVTGKPILVTGGSLTSDKSTMAQLMGRMLEQDYNITARWLENRAWDTQQNAEFSAQMLKAEGIDHVILVTSAWHLNRSVPIFEKTGLKVTAAGTGYAGYTSDSPLVYKFIPSGEAVYKTRNALHEMLGAVYYWLRF